MKKGITNINLKKLISELNKTGKPLWKRIASDLNKPRRIRREVNLTRIERYSKDGETIIIPGKLLGDGILNKKLTISAFNASNMAMEKIKASGSSFLSISELIKKNPEGKGVKILG